MQDKINHSSKQTSLFVLSAAILTAISLWPVWANDFPAMQDYPQHLFISHLINTFQDTSFNWQHYLVDFKFGPYAFFYLLMNFLSQAFTPLVSGKIYLTFYILLLPLIIHAARPKQPESRPPWAMLFLFPLAFHQMYYMGFTNYIFSIPLLIFALNNHIYFTKAPITRISFSKQFFLIFLIFLCHPYTTLVYIILAFASAAGSIKNRRQLIRGIIPPMITSAIFIAWYVQTQPNAVGKMPLLWWPFKDVFTYYLLIFSGMRWSSGVDWQSIILWGAAGAIIIPGIIFLLSKKTPRQLPWEFIIFFVLSTIGFFCMPYWAGKYSYFNLRLAPVSYFSAAIIAGYFRLPKAAGIALACIAALLLLKSASTQHLFSHETAQILPLLSKMEKNAKILPMIFEKDSEVLDKKFFPEAHAHDYFYYHIIVGGGASPSLFPSPMLPVKLKNTSQLPEAIHDFSWQEHGRFYDYILSRKAPDGFDNFLKKYTKKQAASGDWILFGKK